MDPMIIHTTVLIISGIFTAFLMYKIQKKYNKNYYFLSMLIPICFLLISINIFSPELISPKPIDKIKLAENYIYEGNPDKAIELLTKIEHSEDIAIKLSTAYFVKGLRHAEDKEYDQAQTNLHKAKNTAPKDAYFLDDIDYFINKIKNIKD